MPLTERKRQGSSCTCKSIVRWRFLESTFSIIKFSDECQITCQHSFVYSRKIGSEAQKPGRIGSLKLTLLVFAVLHVQELAIPAINAKVFSRSSWVLARSVWWRWSGEQRKCRNTRKTDQPAPSLQIKEAEYEFPLTKENRDCERFRRTISKPSLLENVADIKMHP